MSVTRNETLEDQESCIMNRMICYGYIIYTCKSFKVEEDGKMIHTLMSDEQQFLLSRLLATPSAGGNCLLS